MENITTSASSRRQRPAQLEGAAFSTNWRSTVNERRNSWSPLTSPLPFGSWKPQAEASPQPAKTPITPISAQRLNALRRNSSNTQHAQLAFMQLQQNRQKLATHLASPLMGHLPLNTDGRRASLFSRHGTNSMPTSAVHQAFPQSESAHSAREPLWALHEESESVDVYSTNSPPITPISAMSSSSSRRTPMSLMFRKFAEDAHARAVRRVSEPTSTLHMHENYNNVALFNRNMDSNEQSTASPLAMRRGHVLNNVCTSNPPSVNYWSNQAGLDSVTAH